MGLDYATLNAALSMIQKGIDVSDIHVDKPASNFSLAYRQGQDEFIADKWAPILPVEEIAGNYYKFNKETFYRDRAKPWTPGSGMAQGAFDVDHTSTYSCNFYAYEHPLPVHLNAAADSVLNLERSVNEIVTAVMQLNREINIAAEYFKAAAWTTTYTGTTATATGTNFIYMDDYVNSNPRKVFKDIRIAVKKLTGITPNTVVMSEQGLEALRLHPQLLEMHRALEVPILNDQQIATDLGFSKMLVGKAMKVTSEEGDTTVLDWIYGKNAWVGYVQPRPALMAPSSMYTMSWNKALGGFDTALEVVPDRRTHANYYQGFQCYDPVVVSADLGAFMTGLIAP
jgi:hypothetical protein